MHKTMCESRLVVLPKFQGLGLGTNISELIAAHVGIGTTVSLPTRRTRGWEVTELTQIFGNQPDQMERPVNSLNGKQFNNFSAEIIVLKVTKVAIIYYILLLYMVPLKDFRMEKHSE